MPEKISEILAMKMFECKMRKSARSKIQLKKVFFLVKKWLNPNAARSSCEFSVFVVVIAPCSLQFETNSKVPDRRNVPRTEYDVCTCRLLNVSRSRFPWIWMATCSIFADNLLFLFCVHFLVFCVKTSVDMNVTFTRLNQTHCSDEHFNAFFITYFTHNLVG